MNVERAMIRVFWNLHRGLYRVSGGRIGERLFTPQGLGSLLLTTTGRTSGRPRSTALFFLAEGERLAVVASKLGSDRDPAWWRNLQATPEAEVRLGPRRRRVRAREATPEERAALWPRFVAAYPNYARYEERTSRRIPIVLLEPAATPPGADSGRRTR